jgi:hypothetical protein
MLTRFSHALRASILPTSLGHHSADASPRGGFLRAEIAESTDPRERAAMEESTAEIERAMIVEGTEANERAVSEESTAKNERAASGECTGG